MSGAPFIQHPASFRDPAGFVLIHDGQLYRQVNRTYAPVFEQLMQSGFDQKLIAEGHLIPHEVVSPVPVADPEAAYWLKPERLPFISYPSEWSFDMLRDAALLTLQIQQQAIEAGWSLKDATPYNVQWKEGRPVFIDTLSFEPYQEKPWVAYRQFCQQFLAPLLIMHYCKKHLPELYRAWPDGIPADLAPRLLPWRSRWSVHVALHIHLQARYARREAVATEKIIGLSKARLQRLLLSLQTLIKSLKTPASDTEWASYYEEASQRGVYLEKKEALIRQWLEEAGPLRGAADLGANDGRFAEILGASSGYVIAADIDPACINRLYRRQQNKEADPRLFPVVQDLALPSPNCGAADRERQSFQSRLRTDLILALALIHHLAIGRKMPFAMMAEWLAPMAPDLIIEFVPPEDEKAAQLLNRLEGLPPAYSQELFEASFSMLYNLYKKSPVDGSVRTLYWWKRK